MEIFVERDVGKTLRKYLNVREIIALVGTRQCGKTTLINHILNEREKEKMKVSRVSFDNLKELHLFESDIDSFVERYIKGFDILFIDEVHYSKDGGKKLKYLYDNFKIKIIISGSSAAEISIHSLKYLVGRIFTFTLYPFSFKEFLIFKNKNYKLKNENAKAINDELVILAEEYIKFGGYPKIVLEKLEDKKLTYLSQIINTYIRKDIRDIGNIRNVSSFNKLIEILASQSGQLLNILELSNTLDTNRETISEYLDLLENTFIIKRITPFHKNLRSELSKNPKVYFLDTGMMNLLWLKEFPKVILGNVFETFVFLELMKSGKKINFWRTTNKQEVDFVLMEGKNKICGIEVKYNFDNSDMRNLKSFTKEYNCRGEIVGLKGKKSGKYIWELIKE